MTFCVSHQKQLGSFANGDEAVDSNEIVTQNNDARLNHPNGTENLILGKHETKFMDYIVKILGALSFYCVCVCI
jgi:hypothetical protein